MALHKPYYLTFFIIFFFTVHSPTLASADEIQGCGGFVEASSSLIKSRKPTDSKLDYSHITVELRTLDGLVKDRTQCAPNGYYFIPVYDKGSFVLKIKGPEGWSWNPDQVPVLVDQSGCNKNEDINFRFTGFSISGKVAGAVGGASCSSTNGGPSNVNVELLDTNRDVVSSVLTSSTGSYSFTNVNPGRYNLQASHSDLNIEVKGSTEVELGFGNIQVDDIFFVSGYDIKGSVVAQGNPILGVHFYLYSNDVKEVHCPQGSGNPSGDRTSLCHAVSDVDGTFRFKSIPCGVYELIPYYKGENTVFDVYPPSVAVTVQHDHAILSETFQVTGFSVGGRVVDSNGKGVDGVKVLVDGVERSITDKEGYYKLDQVTSKQYQIEAKKEHYKFDKLINFMVLPNMASVADIKAVSYDVCGSAQTVDTGYKAKVALTHGPHNVKPQIKQIDDNGNFCFEVPPGDYRLSAIAAASESNPDLLFSPPHIDVNVNGPLLSLKFYQAKVNVHGSVTCKEICDSSVSVDLVRLDGKNNEERQTVGLNGQDSKFLFQNVLPGRYKLEVKHLSKEAIPQDNWCWEQSSVHLNVGAEDVEGINFVQKGYWINLVSSHDVDAYLLQSDGSRVNLKIKIGPQRICVDSPGVHELHFENSCILFGNSPVKIDTSNTAPIYLKGEKYLLQGQIRVELSSPNAADNLPENLSIDIVNVEGTVIDSSSATSVVTGNEQLNAAAIYYEYKVWANPGERLSFVPRDTRNKNEKKILFYPRQHQVKVAKDGCQASVPTFSGRLGLYIEGSVYPPLSDVTIRILASGDSHDAQIKKNELAYAITTNKDGSFIGGPLYDGTTYHIEASKHGYHVKKIGPYSFSCQKLGQISVTIHSKENANELFPSVLLSLSGEDGYRNNSISAAGGNFVFDNLFPGSFYLRPLLKEYAFSPSAQAIELGSGESREVTFHATRVAYSAMGVVTLLSGLLKEGVSVEARSDLKGYYEETVTDPSGRYRLRGLHPDTTYTIRIAKIGGSYSSKIERASPESVDVKVGYEDIKSIDFLVFEQPDTTILTGTVSGKRIKEIYEHLRLEVRSANDPTNIESLSPLSLSNFFQVKGLSRGKHLLQLRSTLPSRNLRLKSDVIEVDLEKNSLIHVGPLTYEIEDDHHKQELTPAPVYQLVIGVLVIALFISIPRIKDMYQSKVAILVTGPTTSTKKVVRKRT
ncbi:uncharacterized protein [Rutidosis leptorrhynchoides]|uniref:uncharacterized protein n=1 Tax=Rutidosis leptorrhynchoides TaxID=125765 RepID=UPI003A99DA10